MILNVWIELGEWSRALSVVIQVPSGWGTRFFLHQTNHHSDSEQANVRCVVARCMLRMWTTVLTVELVSVFVSVLGSAVLGCSLGVECLTDSVDAEQDLMEIAVGASVNV